MKSSGVLTVPRRWNVTVDGIKWIPRLIDKARMRARGNLGNYLLGHSPVDRSLLPNLGVDTETFAAIAIDAPDDMSVLEALRARGFDEAAVRRWSDRFERRYKTYITLWDLDEGYLQPTPLTRPLLLFAKVVEGPAMAALRLVVKAP